VADTTLEERREEQMITLGLPHWLMMGGDALSLIGLIGFALSRNLIEADAASPTAGDTKNGEPSKSDELRT
jgi:hypothetical protein